MKRRILGYLAAKGRAEPSQRGGWLRALADSGHAYCLPFVLVFLVILGGCDAVLPPCASDGDCFVGEACIASVCVVQLAITDAGRDAQIDVDDLIDRPGDCRIDVSLCRSKVCNTKTGDCISCEFDMQCGPQGVCDESSGNCFCESGRHRCDGVCVVDDDVETCGERCAPCPRAANGEAICDDGQCDIQCNEGLLKCDTSCNVSPEVCVECLTSSHCPQDKPVCDGGTCVDCKADPECSRFDDAKICNLGACVQCTSLRRSACNTTSCNPSTHTCTATLTASVDACEVCVADEECEPDHRCVPMTFRNSPRTETFCLPEGSSCPGGGYSILVSRASVSTDMVDSYCTINEELISCEAYMDYFSTCDSPEDCGANGVNDGLCKPFPNVGRRCTMACLENDDCPGSTTCIGNPPNSSYCLTL